MLNTVQSLEMTLEKLYNTRKPADMSHSEKILAERWAVREELKVRQKARTPANKLMESGAA